MIVPVRRIHTGGVGFVAAAGAPSVTAILDGTLLQPGTDEADVAAGTQALAVALTNGVFVTGAAFTAARQAIINGLESDGVEGTGWNTVIRDTLDVSSVTRFANGIVVITLNTGSYASYDIATPETITATVPAAAIFNAGSPVVASPTCTINPSTVGTYDGYIDPAGSNANDGSLNSPWLTPAYAIAQLGAGASLGVLPGTYADSAGTIPAGMLIQAVTDGAAIFTGDWQPGDAGFTVRGMLLQSQFSKALGGNNLYNRMSFIGGAMDGNSASCTVLSGTTITESIFYGYGGRYCLIAYEQSNVTLTDIIFRPDGGWGELAPEAQYPYAALNFYDTYASTLTRGIVLDARFSAAAGSQVPLGSVGCNSRIELSGSGACVFTDCLAYKVYTDVQNVANYGAGALAKGFFYADAGGSVDMNIIDCAAIDCDPVWGYSRNCNGVTNLTRWGANATNSYGANKGSINVLDASAPNVTLNTTFLNDARWQTELWANFTPPDGYTTRAQSGWETAGGTLQAYLEAALATH